jgi:hypothetical protein
MKRMTTIAYLVRVEVMEDFRLIPVWDMTDGTPRKREIPGDMAEWSADLTMHIPLLSSGAKAFLREHGTEKRFSITLTALDK